MQRLSEMKLLAGHSESITMTEFRAGPGDVIDQVQLGKTFNITKSGVVVATISPPEPSARELGAEIRRLKMDGNRER